MEVKNAIQEARNALQEQIRSAQYLGVELNEQLQLDWELKLALDGLSVINSEMKTLLNRYCKTDW